MMNHAVGKWRIMAGVVLACTLALARPASAQDPAPATRQTASPSAAPEAAPAKGIRLEVAGGIWKPISPSIEYVDTENGVAGTTLNFSTHLGLQDQPFPAVRATWLMAPKHKLRGQYIRLNYVQKATPTSALTFNGDVYAAGLPVSSTFRWHAMKAGYEYDFVTSPKGFIGAIVDVRDVAVAVTLTNSSVGGTASVHVPMPGGGAAVRYNVSPKFTVSGEAVFSGLPGHAIANTSGHGFDLDGYATVNFTPHVGVQGGFRSFDVTYSMTPDSSTFNSGTFAVRGPYAEGVVRF